LRNAVAKFSDSAMGMMASPVEWQTQKFEDNHHSGDSF